LADGITGGTGRTFSLSLGLFLLAYLLVSPPAQFAAAFLSNPFFSGLMCGFVIVAVSVCPTRQEKWLVALVCLSVEAFRIFRDWTPAFIGLFTVSGSRAALPAMIHIILSGLARPKLRPALIRGVAQASCLPLLYCAGDLLIQGSNSVTGKTYDLYYYAADLTLGPAWCFHVVAWTHQSFLFYTLGYLAYFVLSHVMAITAAWWAFRPQGPNPILYFLACAIVSGGLGYWACAGVGPEVVFQSNFPLNPPAPIAPVLLEVPGGYPRNTMPSLHLLWAYSVWICLIGRGSILRGVGLIYLIGMPLVAFLGRHYLVDFVVALSLAPGIHLLVLRLSNSRVAISAQLWASAAASLAMAPAYLFLLIKGSSVWAVWPWLLSSATLMALALSIYSSVELKRCLQNSLQK